MYPNISYIKAFLTSLLKLIRWPNLVLICLTQCIVFAFIVKSNGSYLNFSSATPLLILSFGTVLVAAAGYIINDYYDIKIDLINKPERIVIGKIISRRQAIFIHSLFNFSAIGLGLLLSWRVALYFATCAFLLWLYSNYLKRTPLLGNLIVSMLTAATIWIVSLYYRENDKLIYLYSIFAFFISLLREIIKDMEDKKGDASYGCKTLPIFVGIRRTKLFLYLLLALFGFLILHQLQTDSLNTSFIGYVLVMPLIYVGYKLLVADKQKDYSHLSYFCKWFMLAGVISLGWI